MTTDRKTVIFAINKPHTDNIKAGKKTSELRKRVPKVIGTYNGLIYETKNRGGCGKVIGQFTAINVLCFGSILATFPDGALTAILRRACVSYEDFFNYSAGGGKGD